MRGIVLNINPYNKSHRLKIDGKIMLLQWEQVKRLCCYLRVGDEFSIMETIKGQKIVPDHEIVEFPTIGKAMIVYQGN